MADIAMWTKESATYKEAGLQLVCDVKVATKLKSTTNWHILVSFVEWSSKLTCSNLQVPCRYNCFKSPHNRENTQVMTLVNSFVYVQMMREKGRRKVGI